MASQSVLVCDGCGSADDVRHRRLVLDITEVDIDLCAKCRKPIERLATKGRVTAGGVAVGVDRIQYAVRG